MYTARDYSTGEIWEFVCLKDAYRVMLKHSRVSVGCVQNTSV